MKTLLIIAAIYGAMFAAGANATEFYYLSQSNIDYYDGLQATACGMLESLSADEREWIIRHAVTEVRAIAQGAPQTDSSEVALAVAACSDGTRMAWFVELGQRSANR